MDIFKKMFHILVYTLGILLVAGCLAYLATLVLFHPSHYRDWELGQERLPRIVFGEEGRVTIEQFRNFDWITATSADVRYETLEVDIDELQTVDVFISHFDEFEGLAHIFLSFGFGGGQQVVVSFETRREKGKNFSPVLGILRQFEIIYVVGSEEDIVGVRTNVRKGERVYMYPTRATPAQAQELFRRIAADINDIYTAPRMYNTLTRNCTNQLTRRVEEISSVRFPLTWKTVMPGYFDEVLYDLGIIATEGTFEEVKKAHLIDNATVDRHSATFSADLRKLVSRP